MEISCSGEILASLDAAKNKFSSEKTAERIWQKDPSVWTDSGEEEWLGWLEIVKKELSESSKYREFAKEFEDSLFETVVLLGMGGSSLCPEVMSVTFEKDGFYILDSTVPAQIRTLHERINVATTLFIVASKSGSTLEPNTFLQYFFDKVQAVVGKEKGGDHFVAITDPGSKLEALAKRDNFWRIFYGEPTVGGRFSALSVFGLIPSAAMGIDVNSFLEKAAEMVSACKHAGAEENPGAVLGLLLGACQKHKRDKLTIYTSDRLYDVGAWMEQLVAESTGKQGVSIIPVDREPIIAAENYGDDRVFTFLLMEGDSSLDSFAKELKELGHPVITIVMDNVINLGQEFFRWEFATAVAGAEMGINPFDQPDVEAAKIEARKLTDLYEETGKLPTDSPFVALDDFKFFADGDLVQRFEGRSDVSIGEVLKSHLLRIKENDYFALLAYIEMNDENEKILTSIRSYVQSKYNVATCLGFGPRFLHSTGQGYKGGDSNGVFLQITSDDAKDLEIPGQSFTFGVVKAAQSRGDFQVLVDRDRRALRVHLGSDIVSGLEVLLSEIQKSDEI